MVAASALAVVNVRDSYSFSYTVNAENTGDFKSHQESRTGGLVRGSYSVLEPGGILRVVEYTADPVRGFQAVVHRRALMNTTEGMPTMKERIPTTVEEVTAMEERSFMRTREELPKKIPTTEGKFYLKSTNVPPKREDTLPLVIGKIPLAREKFFLGSNGMIPKPTQKTPTVERLLTTKERLPIATEKKTTTNETVWLMTDRPTRTLVTTTKGLSEMTGMIPTTEERLVRKTTVRLPDAMQTSRITEGWFLPNKTGMVMRKSERLPTTTGTMQMIEEATHAPSNLGHFAAVMFPTRRKILHRRQWQ